MFDFLHLTFFSFTFYNKFDETYQIFPLLKAYEARFFPNFFLLDFYGLDIHVEPEAEP
jgi:hypothetical protein